MLTAFKSFPIIYINIHINPKELTFLARKSLLELANMGCVLGSQTALLKDINDDVEILSRLLSEL